MQKVFRTHGAKVSQESLAPCATLFCTGATPGCAGARGLPLPGFKRPFAPSPNHFRAFSYFRPLSQALWFAILAIEGQELALERAKPAPKHPNRHLTKGQVSCALIVRRCGNGKVSVKVRIALWQSCFSQDKY